MEIIGNILATVVPVFAIMAMGFIYSRFKKLPVQQLTELLMWIFLPCLVLGSLGSQSIEPLELLQIGAAALIIMTGTGILGFLVFIKRPERRALLLSCMFMNSANMAFPLALFAYGETGLSRQVVFYVAIHVLHVTLGVGLARGRGGIKEVFRLPLIYAAALAVGLALSGVKLPTEISTPLSLVGKATIPIMLILLGGRLADARLAHIKLATLSTIIRIGAGFGLGLFAVWLFGLTGFARTAVLIGSVMPVAVLNFVLGEKYNLYPELLATTVVLSTLVSIGTSPLALYFIGIG
ncbi:MAG: AEC family transporter [Deltaproteobacteria bacterium]|nr:AEC family transporter [Deltaproteobacteria bacterium]